MRKRKSDQDENVRRIVQTTRFTQTSEGWFFKTREGVMLGPYAEEFDAEISASLLIAQLAQLDPAADATPVIQRFITDPANATTGKTAPYDRKPVDLAALKRQNRIKTRIPTFQKAWQAISAMRGHS